MSMDGSLLIQLNTLNSFQIFMTGLLALREATLLSLLLLPLLFSTVYISWYIHNRFASLSDYVNLSQAEEVKRARYSDDTLYEAGALADDIARLRKGHPVSQRQSELNRGRYERSEERMYVVKQDSKTDYAQPPMSEAYYGILKYVELCFGSSQRRLMSFCHVAVPAKYAIVIPPSAAGYLRLGCQPKEKSTEWRQAIFSHPTRI